MNDDRSSLLRAVSPVVPFSFCLVTIILFMRQTNQLLHIICRQASLIDKPMSNVYYTLYELMNVRILSQSAISAIV
jgi:hypothetical protein